MGVLTDRSSLNSESKGEIHELKQELKTPDKAKKKDVVKKVRHRERERERNHRVGAG